MLVKENRRRDYLCEDIERVEDVRIDNQRLVYEFFNLSAPEQRPDSLIFS
jgi:hypothetical protein